jgi:hypothetical protein
MNRDRQAYTFSLSLDPAEMEDNFLDLRVFAPILRDLQAVLREIEQKVSSDPQHSVAWEVEGEPSVRLVATVNGVSADTLSAIVGEARDDFAEAAIRERRQDAVKDIDPKTWRRLKTIITRLRRQASVTVEATGKDAVRIPKDEQPVVLASPEPTTHTEFSEVDGELDIISVRGTPNFVLYEHGTDRRIRCVFGSNLMPAVKEALGKRVLVEGTVRYRRNGTPVRITDVTRFKILPEPSREMSDLMGKLPNFTQGVDAGEYVRRLRSGDGNGN